MSRVIIELKCSLSKERGFIYFNVLLDLVLIAILMPLIILFYMYTAAYMDDLDAGKLEWRLFTSELQSHLTAVDSSRVINGGTGVRIIQEGVEYDIEVYDSFIRKQKFNKGHEIMMTGISNCSFTIEGNFLKITALFSNGTEETTVYGFSSP